MKIKSLHFHEVGPLQDQTIELIDDWSGAVSTRVLLSGPNGCGKSTVLRAVACLWEAAGHWLDRREPLPRPNPARKWLQGWGGAAVVFARTGFTGQDGPDFGLFFGDAAWATSLRERLPAVQWLGEDVPRNGSKGAPAKGLILPAGDWLEALSAARKKLVLAFDDTPLPNVIHLDAEDRRWVSPRKRLGEFLAEPAAMRWLPRYLASDDWDGQLEASLINLKLTNEAKFIKVLAVVNQFLIGKQIDPDIEEGKNRLRVRMAPGTSRRAFIGIDDLSAGEHQVLIILFLIARWAERGCLVMIDEPDLYLHPSLIAVLLSRVEALVDELGGQLLITSHIPSVWHRYEIAGRRVELEPQRDQG